MVQRQLEVYGSVLGPGSSSGAVSALQDLLNQATQLRLPIDGVYGEQTRAAVQFLQRRVGLPPTGRADVLTVLLAQERVAQTRREPRRFLLSLPLPPSGAAARRHLVVETPQHLFVPRLLHAEGLAERETLAAFLAALSRRTGGCVLDVGANVGVFSHLAAALSDWQVWAFEPTPVLAAAIRHIAEVNALTVRVEEVALGRTEGVGTFFLSDVTDASSSLAGGFRPSEVSLAVRLETLDGWCARTGAEPDLLKLDTETTEPDVLAGGAALLARRRPWVICEVLPGRRVADLQAELDRHGYVAQQLLPRGIGEPTQLAPTDEGHNWLLTPEPVDEAFRQAAAAWHTALLAL